MSRMKTDRPVPSGVPKGFRGVKQMDGTPTTQFTEPMRRAPLQDREAVPDRKSDSGMESSMHELADREHRRK